MTKDSTPPIAWRFLNQASAYKVRRGDVLRYYPDRPVGERFTIERLAVMHEGTVDRMILGGALEALPPADREGARQRMVDQVTRDAHSRLDAA